MFNSLKKDIDAVMERDPAARSRLEVYLTYSGVKALRAHRRAHRLYNKKHFLLARMISQGAARRTGIEIHPAAKIGKRFFIDHGVGVVIGETAEIGNDVTLYHGVTLGGTGKDVGKRHPTVREGALVSAHAQIIGPIEIGKNAKVGAGAVVVADVPEDVTVVGVPAK
ncbi:MAG: serine O-acetyltransferase, partial [Spirochaetia bacterium]|nr:serine O-acetyltransferase [Spirochaetia bacterium]